MPQDDDYGFWDFERDKRFTGPMPRLRRSVERDPAPWRVPRSRLHHVADDADAAYVRRPRDRGVDPLWARLGAIGAVGLLALPVAWIVSGGDNDAKVTSAETVVAPVAVEPVTAPNIAGAEPFAVAPPAVETQATVAASAAVTAAATEPPPSTSPATSPAPTSAESGGAFADSAGAGTRVESATEVISSTPAQEVAVVDATVEVTRVCANNYKVVQGDYWILIARKVSLTLKEVLTANNATVDTPLYPGRNICLPWNASAPTTAAPTTAAPTTAAPTTAAPTTAKPTSTTSKPTTTTAAPTTTEAPPKNTYTQAQVIAIIRDVWPDDLEDEAIRIATRESNLIPTVRNWCCYGLFQIYYAVNKASLVSWGITSASMLYDPKVNAYAAYAMYLRAGGWGPWQ